MNNKNKKGFTLVELAVVLVVIGIIATIAIKANGMISVSRLRADLANTAVIKTAFAAYYQHYKLLPGDTTGNDIININDTINARDSLIASGYIDAKAFTISGRAILDNTGNNYYWGFSRCVPTTTGYTIVNDNTINRLRGNVCITPTSNTAMNTAPGLADFARLTAGYELFFDDAALHTGDGRTSANNSTVTRATIETHIDNPVSGKFGAYFIKIW